MSVNTSSSLFANEYTHNVYAERLLREFRDHIHGGLPFKGDISALESVVDALKNPNGIDDRKMLLENILIFLANHSTTEAGEKLSTATVELLYDDLPHPPQTFLGDDKTPYAWRTADGSGNNPDYPDLGKAGTPYARSASQSHALPLDEMPDASLVYETLLKREKFVKHPAGLSSMMFAFAALVIHSIFRTSTSNTNINDTSSYVDLAPLYGNDKTMQHKIRKLDGRGLLHPDTFAEDRLLLLPPTVAIILICFNRNHNYIARMLLQINERGTWADPSTISSDDPLRTKKLLEQDEEIFQTARLINCAWFASVVFSDYFSAILGLVRQGSSWSLDPFLAIRRLDHSLFERGRGNACSVEFNCLYRWHATTSEPDAKWVEKLFSSLWPDKKWDTLSIAEFKQVVVALRSQETDASHWTLGDMKRQEDGSFRGDQLANILHDACEHPAAAFGARGTPPVMQLHEIMGIEASRAWGVCSLNDFREFLGLKRYGSFLEWNPDPEIAKAAEKLYGNIERLELYAGLQAEESKPVEAGAGLCPGYTISRAILSDAIALTRGDRFYTADYTSFNMTSWGFADCQKDPSGPGNGSMLGRLLLRTLPEYYSYNSTEAWFPLMTPEAMKIVLTNLKELDQYDLQRPVYTPPIPEVKDYIDVAQIMSKEQFNVLYSTRAARILKGDGFYIASSNPARGARQQRSFVKALTGVPGSEDKIARYFYEKTRELMFREAYSMVDTQTKNVDIVRDVLKYVPLCWASELAGIHLKQSPSGHGDFTRQELFDILGDIYIYLFGYIIPEKQLRLEQKVKIQIENLLSIIKSRLLENSCNPLTSFVKSLAHIFSPPQKTERHEFIERFTALGETTDTLAHSLLALLVGATVEMSLACVNVVNFYLDENNTADFLTLASKAKLGSDDQKSLRGFVLEALRLDPPFRGVYRESTQAASIGALRLSANQTVFVDIARANLDEHVFPNPAAVNCSRTAHERPLVGDGSAKCLGVELSTTIISEMVRAVFGFQRIRRAPGKSGQLKRFKEDTTITSIYTYLSATQQLTPWPTSLVVQFD